MAASSQSMAFFIFFLALCCCSLAHAHPSVHRHRSLSSPKPLLSRVHETPESATIQTAGESVIVPVPEDQRGEASPQRGLLPENVRVQMQTLLDSPLFETSDKIIDLHPPTIVIPEQRLGRRHGGPSSYGFPWPGSDNDLETKLSTLQDTLNELIPLLQEYIVQVPAESPAASASTAIVALTGTITSTLDTEPTPTSSLAPEVSLTTTGAPSATPTAVTTPANYIFNPTSQSNNAVYYGQLRTNPTLSDVCADPNIDIIIISFLSYLTNTPPANATGSVATAGWPTLNVAAHCWAPTVAQNAAGAGTLVDCVGSGFSQKVQTCQQSGKKVLLSLGGAVGYSNTVLASADVATAVAQNVWDLFLGGGHDLDGIKPFGPDVVFDGIDIDNESGSTENIDVLMSSLRNLFASDPDHTYYMSSAPQCPQPDRSIPLTSMQTVTDFIWVQFYNNPQCNLGTSGFLESLANWSESLTSGTGSFQDIDNGVTAPMLHIGAPAFPGVGSGFVGDGEELRSILDSVKDFGLPNLGGAMWWDGALEVQSAQYDANNETFAQIVKDVLA